MSKVKEVSRVKAAHGHRWELLVRQRDGDLYGCEECGQTRWDAAHLPPMSPLVATLVVASILGLIGFVALAILGGR